MPNEQRKVKEKKGYPVEDEHYYILSVIQAWFSREILQYSYICVQEKGTWIHINLVKSIFIKKY